MWGKADVEQIAGTKKVAKTSKFRNATHGQTWDSKFGQAHNPGAPPNSVIDLHPQISELDVHFPPCAPSHTSSHIHTVTIFLIMSLLRIMCKNAKVCQSYTDWGHFPPSPLGVN